MHRLEWTIHRLAAVAARPELSHGAFRLYVLLKGVAVQTGEEHEYFPVTLAGLTALHPGIVGREVGATTVVKQVAALRHAGLLDIRAAIHRTEPRKPVLIRVLDPDVEQMDLASIVNSQ